MNSIAQTGLNLQHVLGVTKARKTDMEQWLGHCPVHDDKNPSLSITEENGKVLIHCHAGCPQNAVYDALATSANNPPAYIPSVRDTNKKTTQRMIGFSYPLSPMMLHPRPKPTRSAAFRHGRGNTRRRRDGPFSMKPDLILWTMKEIQTRM